MSAEAPSESLDALLRKLAELQRLVPPSRDASNEPQTPAGTGSSIDSGDAARLLGQVLLTYTVAGLRYWARVAEGWAKALPLASQAMTEAAGPGGGGGGGEMSRVRLEELGAHLRELAAIPSEEARRLGNDLERLALAAESIPRRDSQEREGTYWRRWEIKP